MNETSGASDTHSSLIARLANLDDSEAWREYVRSYETYVRRLVARAGVSQANVDDVVQQVQIAVARTIHQFHARRRPGAFRRWLANRALWKIIDQRRCDRKADLVLMEYLQQVEKRGGRPVADHSESIPYELRAELLQHLVRRILLRHFDPEKIQMYQFLVLDGWSPARVARFYGRTPAYVYLVKFRITKVLRREASRFMESAPELESQ